MRKILTIIATLVLLVVIGAGVVNWLGTGDNKPLPGPDQPTTEAEQPDWCPKVEVVAAPGTWESAPNDDPINPTFNPASFMLTVTQPLQQRYTADEVKVWTLPYTAQFKNVNAMHEMSYDQSRQEGTSTLENELRIMNRDCPKTDFVLVGFSQGAVIVGDLANQIGAGHGVIPAERVRGVAVVADGRREPGVGQAQGNPVAGVGAEVSLELLNPLTQAIMPGATMRGPREGGFGVINDRVMDICAPDDHICDAPLGVGNAVTRAQALIAANAVHAQYATNPNVFPGSTTTQWLIDWATGLIDAK
ncbi:Cutinase [Corynebacterium kalinowskii]|uniref:Cutinase n=1 Tax=Corynebacterium kalinowskii TaxID=2675216 RepID=A0A6B8VDH9_9CORY|nr:cutinase family protein [Corynebacterium kalinowskii]QGU01119.1 Cutinase [Corynebacterium kalinowskii]